MQKIQQAVEKYRSLILDAEEFIWKHPETGYREKITSQYMENAFEQLGYTLVRAENITGFYTQIDTGREGPTVLILGELDSIICPSHPDADPVTGAVHSCGHHAQCAALLGIAAALTEPAVLEPLCGKIRLCAVPAEELLEIEYRSELKKQGIIRYFGGKTEFLSRGYFDGVDLAFMVHTSKSFAVRQGSVGCIVKSIIYKGVASHAGGAPWNGRNALYAASCGMQAVNAIRETFKEADIIRFHPIITQGGDMVNAIPETACLESYVRGKNYKGILEANRKINRALCGAALSLGTNIEIVDIPGYAPLNNDPNMVKLAKDAAALALPEYEFNVREHYGSGSTDMGDLSVIMPVVHPYAAGAEGRSHGNDYHVTDKEAACIENAKWQLTMLKLLLENNAARAKDILASFTPTFASKEEFLSFLDGFNSEGDRISYLDDRTAQIRID